MPVRVKVRAVIWIDDLIIVHKVNQRGALHVTLPGGRVNERESVIDALKREVLEEIGIEISVGDLMFAAEVISGATRQDVELIFAAKPIHPIASGEVALVDPREPEFSVLPPILRHIVYWRDGALRYQWLGNIYASQVNASAPAPDE